MRRRIDARDSHTLGTGLGVARRMRRLRSGRGALMSAVHHLKPFAAPDEVWLIVKGEPNTVCDRNGVTVATTTDDANAQLIALVPDMIALLQELLKPSAFDGKRANESDTKW